jgi:hypothetical protein
MCEHGGTDPRCGEWTALEIVSQATWLVGQKPSFGPKYIQAAKIDTMDLPHVHPANFRIPAEWLQWQEERGKKPSWDEWRASVERNKIGYVAKEDRVRDFRYTPLIASSALFFEINPVRGIGLLLYGLLRKNFDLPAIWNGPGHGDVLTKLPRLLLAEMTCSSWTLGILAGCLWPRATENLFQKRYPQQEYTPENDTLQDPISFLDTDELGKAIRISQTNLTHYQLSTIGGRARQLTPVSIRQLTQPDWNKIFEMPVEGEDPAHD